MARTRTIQNSFNAGEFSPLLEGRTDLQKYANSARTIENFICLKHGGVNRRPGTHFVTEVKTSAKKTRLIPFQFSTVQAYVIEVGDIYMRFYKDGHRIEDPPGTPIEVSTPYLEAELFDIHFAQSADVMYMVHPNHPAMKLEHFSDLLWTLVQIDFQNGPFLDERTDITFTPDATSGVAVNVVASAPFFNLQMGGALLRLKFAGDYGYAKIISVSDDEHAVVSTVVDFTDSAIPSTAFQEGSWSIYRGFPATVTLFQQRSWWANTTNNPDTVWGSKTSDYENMDPGTGLDDEAVTFTLASNRVNAITWMAPSRDLLIGTIGQEWDVSGGSTDNPITPANINARAQTTYGGSIVSPVQVHNAVLFLQRSGRRVREYSYDFTSDSYSAPDLTLLSDHLTQGGITQMDYQQERDSIIWAVRADGQLLGLTYERPQDVVAWHRHITDGLFESVATIPNPSTDEDQTWVIVQRNISTTKAIVDFIGEVVSTQTHVTFHVPGHGLSPGDLIAIGDADPTFYNSSETHVDSVVDADHIVVVYPSALALLIGTGGVISKLAGTRRYIEYLDTRNGFYSSLQTDSSVVYSGSPVSTITGLNHLEGKTVDILGGGSVYPPQVVLGGQVTGLNPAVTQAEVGLHYDSTLITMRPEAGADSGTAQGAQKRNSQIIVRIYKSLGVTVNNESIPFRKSGDNMDKPVPLFTGDKKMTNLGWDSDAIVKIRQTQPLPLTVLAIIGVLTVGESDASN